MMPGMGSRLAALLVLLVLAAGAAGCGGGDGDRGPDRPVIRLGTKNFTEQFILGELYARALRAKGFDVQLERNLGSSELVDRALTGGGIDMYLEYTGVIVTEIAKQRGRPESARETLERARAFEGDRGLSVLRPTPAADALALAVLPETAQRHRLQRIPDLARLGRFRYGGPAENELRIQGARGVRRVYGLDFDFVPLRIDRRYEALDRGRVDVVDVFTTEGQLAVGRYVVLEDSKHLFGYQNMVPVVDKDTVREQGPGFVEAVNAVSAALTDDVLRRLNGAVDLRGEDPADVAERFLREQRLR